MSGRAPLPGHSQPLMLQPPAVDFIDNRMWQYHDAFDTRLAHYSPGRGQYVANLSYSGAPFAASLTAPNAPEPPQPRPTPEIINDMDFWTEVFPKAMQQLKITSAPKCLPEWNLRTTSNWPDAQAKLEIAQRDYDFQHSSQHAGKFRRTVRSALDKSAVPLQQITRVIPSVEMSAPILRVADLLLDAYRQAAEVRDTVDCGFDDLPVFFANLEFYFKLFPGDNNILKAAVSFVLCTLKAIEDAVLFYTSRQAKRAGLAIFTGEQYQRNLKKSLTEMKASAEAFVTQANVSFHHHEVSENKQNRLSHAEIKRDNWLSHQALRTIIHERRTDFDIIVSVQNHILALLQEMKNNGPPHSPMPSRPTTPLPIQSFSVTPEELWSRLQISNFDEVDMRKALESAADVLYPDLCRAEQIFTTPIFRRWFLHPGSSKLLVHGDFDTWSRITPFSVLCATVMQGFRSSLGIISLVFFCGRHLRDEEVHGGNAIIRSLTAQLLRQFPASTLEFGPAMATEDLGGADIDQLCHLFTRLVRLLPAQTPIFCLVDGINEYEQEGYMETMADVVISLVQLVEEEGSRARFKLVLLSPRPTFEVKNAFNEPGTLLNMEQLPLIEERANLAGLQEQLD